MNIKVTFDYTDIKNPKIKTDISEVVSDMNNKLELAIKEYLDKIPRFTVDIEKDFIKRK